MKPGQYVLACDVKNPRPDRRQRYDWRTREVWYAGSEFTIYEDHHIREGSVLLAIRETWGRWSHHYLYLTGSDERAAALVGALTPAERTGARDLKALLGQYESERVMFSVVAKLLDTRVLDLDQVKVALDAVNADDEKEEGGNEPQDRAIT